MSKLSRKFYTRPALIVAKELLGKYLVKKEKNGEVIGKIVETEAYVGVKDKAFHAYRGKVTKRCKPVYLKGGHVYIYLCYGVHWQLNIVTEKKGSPECVLIRALEPICNNSDIKKTRKLANGPGKLCRWMGLNKSFNEEDLTNSKRIWLKDGKEIIKKSRIVTTKRIGIDYAEEWAEKPLRFYIKDNLFVSRK